MAFEIEVSASGWFAWAVDRLGSDRVYALARKALRQTLTEWGSQRKLGPVGLQARFFPSQAQAFGFSSRSAAYDRAKRRNQGRVVPYRSPWRGKVHMQDLLRQQGSGWRVQLRNRRPDIEGIVKLPGARVLNLLSGDSTKYKREFLRIEHPSQSADRRWILSRYGSLLLEMISKATQPGQRGRPKKVQKPG